MTTQIKYRKYEGKSAYYSMDYRMYSAGFADDSHLRSLGGHGSGGGGGGRSLRSTQGFGPKTYDPYNILHLKGNGVNAKAGTRTNPKQHYTKINVHNIEKNMCHLNFDNYPRDNDEFLVINRQVTLASNNGVSTYQWLTSLQISLDTYGTFDQGLGGFITGIASGMIDVYRGNYVDAAISLLSAVPVVGIVGDVMKAGRNAERVAKNITNLTKGLNKILKNVDEGIVDLSKFNSKGVYKNWKIEIDHSAKRGMSHAGSYWKLTNKYDKNFRRTLDINGRIKGD